MLVILFMISCLIVLILTNKAALNKIYDILNSANLIFGYNKEENANVENYLLLKRIESDR